MKELSTRGQAENIVFVFLPDTTSTTGDGKTGLTNASAGLTISVRREKSAAITSYSGANILSVTTLGTWEDPGVGNVRFREVGAALPGVYEIHLLDSLFAASDTSRKLVGMVRADGVAPTPFEVPLVAVNPQDAAAFGLSRVDVTIGSRSNHSAADVWAVGSRTLTSFGTLASDTATAVWGAGARTLTGFGTLVSDVWAHATRTLTAFGFGVTVTTNNDKTGYALTPGEHTTIQADVQAGMTAQGYTSARGGYLDTLNGLVANIWANGTRTLTSFGTLVSDTATAVWGAGARTLTGFGTLVSDVWAHATRTLTAFGFGVTVTTNNDKTGYTLADGSLTGATLAASAITALQAGLATAAGLTALQADMTALLNRLTLARAGYLDNLNIGGPVASEASVDAVAALLDTEIAQIIALLERVDGMVENAGAYDRLKATALEMAPAGEGGGGNGAGIK